MARKTWWILAVIAALPVGAAFAQSPLDGYVIARSACAATPSIRSAANDPSLPLEVERAYRLVGENKKDGTHYLIEVPGAKPEQRWIEKRCGERVAAVDAGSASGGSDGEAIEGANSQLPEDEPASDVADSGNGAQAGAAHRNLLLAISWEPAFCETHERKPECRSMTDTSFDARHFSLHGLWPQPRGTEYCGVPEDQKADDRRGRWDRLPAVALDPEVKTKLDKFMPGTQSRLERHEWTRHGTCYGADANEYFRDSIAALEAIDASAVGALFAGALERPLSADKIRAAFDQAFGPGAGSRVKIACDRDGDRRLISELTIGLVGEITPEPDMKALIMAARPTSPGCTDGIVDAAGLQ
ncbi:ribonuclease [Aurantimonas sp. VKM B-3413]|uniref:ribonuclease T2 family protein n=1 Tax=Aurantimonas sp. VKM B-3413 TaxID=2779401 RepID=UPI001E396751|nr:ribonuclease [Aurantimonas sp. VKM B-3413]MCB8836522.1 ribonuclease [Aurantimonas sp. VKM B-3413]